MKKLTLTNKMLVTGEGALSYIKEIPSKRAVIVTGGSSMKRTGVIDKVTGYLEEQGAEVFCYGGIQKNPTTIQVMEGLAFIKEKQPDTILAVGGGSSIDAAKVMLLFYDFPELNFDNVFKTDLDSLQKKTTFVAVPSTSGTASEVTKVSVITFPEIEFKYAVRSMNIFPDIAILDPSLPQTLPAKVAAETGMDALTHAIESYINKNGNDFTDALAKEAIEGIMEYLPASVLDADPKAREKMHNYQCMAGMAFANSGLGMVHGVAHAFGGKYNVAHGLINAVVLPYAMEFNKQDPDVAAKFARLSRILGKDVIQAVRDLKAQVGIAKTVQEMGISEETFKKDFDQLLANSMKGSTTVNPVKVTEEDMKKFLNTIYYGA